jgi:hypothetical protein
MAARMVEDDTVEGARLDRASARYAALLAQLLIGDARDLDAGAAGPV